MAKKKPVKKQPSVKDPISGAVLPKKKRTVERKHEVKAELSNVELVKAKSSLTLTVYAKKEKIGEIHIGRGSLYWFGPKRQKSKRIGWSKFAEMMDRLAYGEQ